MNDDSPVWSVVFLVIVLIIWASLLFSGSCNISSPVARRLLAQEGVTDVLLGGHAYFSCGKDDTFSIRFSGTKNGMAVKGAICGGWYKEYTIRYE